MTDFRRRSSFDRHRPVAVKRSTVVRRPCTVVLDDQQVVKRLLQAMKLDISLWGWYVSVMGWSMRVRNTVDRRSEQ